MANVTALPVSYTPAPPPPPVQTYTQAQVWEIVRAVKLAAYQEAADRFGVELDPEAFEPSEASLASRPRLVLHQGGAR
jgi:hypothetical protein